MKRCAACRRMNADDAVTCVFCGKDEWEAVGVGDGGNSPVPVPAGGQNAAENAFLDQIKAYAEESQVRDPKIIVFFGHSNSGKSWFITRAKKEKGDLGYFAAEPPLEKEGRQLGTSIAPRAHIIHSAPRDGLVLIDIEGERFTDALENGFRGEYRVFVEALACAHGFAFLIPASEALYPRLCERHAPRGLKADVANERMQMVLNNISRVGAFLKYLKAQKKAGVKRDQAVRRFLALDNDARTKLLNAAVRKGGRTNIPAMIILSKADSLAKLMDDAGSEWAHYAPHYDHDPMGDITTSEGPVRMLLKAFRYSFRRFRVDFATAFEGHEEFPSAGGDRDITWDPSKPHRGVVSAMRWMRDEIKTAHTWRRFVTFNLGVGPALWLRGCLDKDFRRAI